MVTVYKTNNKASKQAIAYLKQHEIEYVEKSYRKNLSEGLLMNLFTNSIDGIDPLMAKRSDGYRDIVEAIDDLKLSDLIHLILKDPTIIKTPIIMDDKHLVAGFSKDTIRVFFPRNS